MINLSPTSTNNGTCKEYPVETVALLVAFEAVFPFTPGSHSTTSKVTFSGT